ncbi:MULTISPECIES: alpha/beta fold hydrolase [unclassified Streptomyces]|uniref:alpha/beta fold hydrolase n=1 Tax=unclassified Streptomyces TaxID=2593676 RepID=UPI0004AA0B14|nr:MULTISPECIES: alpha/beta hydrolase [unclassified Streptomyces]APU43794.1 alpha/beta hydrolase [Streptomyces sp. TN58]KJK53365.1 alpha/beta hydrolase [Streptomyces sp. NRRL F-4428]
MASSTFTAPDGTLLAYRARGSGEPVVCIPGGPADSAYLGDLGGLSAHRRLVVLDLRGTGRSAVPQDPGSYRSDRLVDDIEALRGHLGLDRIDLLAHSAGANPAVQYAARYPDRIGRLALITPGTRAVGTVITGDTRRELARRRAHEPWFPAAFAALEDIIAGAGGDPDAIAPFFYGRWDAEARRHHTASRPDNPEAVARFGAEGAFDPEATRAGLTALRAPALLLAGEFDLNSPPGAVAECAELFPHATLVVQPGAGHYPWLDDAGRFVAATAAFLG